MYDDIAAISTASGTGGVAIIRISGKNALKIALNMFSSSANLTEVKPNYMYSGNIAGDGFTDYGFMVYFKAPKSFTGEDIVEFHCHGGAVIARGILKKALSFGARAAERGEFTRRAFLNGKLSLASAEGMADMINAESLALVRAGSMMYNEKLTAEVRVLQDILKDLLARSAVEIDYPEEDEDGVDFNAISNEIKKLSKSVTSLITTYSGGKKLKSGVSVAICGKPNTGKSSLLNALLGYDKAIVSSQAGTTRDIVEGEIELFGVKYILTDTAGIRERAGEVESIGIERAKSAVLSADIVLSVTDGSGEAEIPRNFSGNKITVFNKCDKVKPFGGYDIAVSAKTGEGLEELKKKIADAGVGEPALDKVFIVEERHYDALKRAEKFLSSAAENVGACTLDLITVDLKEAWDALGEITGETANEEIISCVFEKFCVGK
ncbi:MAG: tRNA uridine-5-carboxymethylaminomethyl(34) synthesis GTPase MnmE [Clostridia bacterium]|nr:tRNA uridine-5-carboxymethylaminomethyl(34) synthesis GTPase MnmE [Clostridia bacterium]